MSLQIRPMMFKSIIGQMSLGLKSADEGEVEWKAVNWLAEDRG